MEGQGYKVKDNIVYQDNQSAILLEKNGQRLSTKRTRHLNMRYFFVTDRIQAKELTVEYCPTGDMWADIHTKPLQGAAFVKFRELILNLSSGGQEVDTPIVHRSVLDKAGKEESARVSWADRVRVGMGMNDQTGLNDQT